MPWSASACSSMSFMATSHIDELLTAHEVAALLKISLRTFERMIRAGNGPVCSRIGRQRRWRVQDVHAWVAQQQTPSPQSEKGGDRSSGA